MAVTLGLLGFTTRPLQAASGNTNAVLISFQISALIQQSTIVTNGDVLTSTLSSIPVKIGNQNILNLLQAEFGTTFPTGAQLAYNLTGSTGFRVLDQNGHPILDASTNAADSSYRFTLSNNVAGATMPGLVVGKVVDNTVTSNQTQTLTDIVPDYGVYYADGNGNHFHLTGVLTFKPNISITSSSFTYNAVSFTIVGAGGGTFFNPADGKFDDGVFTKAKVSAKGTGLTQ
jgi:hypothetical protein